MAHKLSTVCTNGSPLMGTWSINVRAFSLFIFSRKKNLNVCLQQQAAYVRVVRDSRENCSLTGCGLLLPNKIPHVLPKRIFPDVPWIIFRLKIWRFLLFPWMNDFFHKKSLIDYALWNFFPVIVVLCFDVWTRKLYHSLNSPFHNQVQG